MKHDILIDSIDTSYELTWGIRVPESQNHFITYEDGHFYWYNDIDYSEGYDNILKEILPQLTLTGEELTKYLRENNLSEEKNEITFHQAVLIAEHFGDSEALIDVLYWQESWQELQEAA